MNENHSSFRRRLVRGVEVLRGASGIGLGKAVSELVRKGMHAPLRTRIVNGFHVVELPPDSPMVSSADVNKLKD